VGKIRWCQYGQYTALAVFISEACSNQISRCFFCAIQNFPRFPSASTIKVKTWETIPPYMIPVSVEKILTTILVKNIMTQAMHAMMNATNPDDRITAFQLYGERFAYDVPKNSRR
jgi:hypothetical protein